MVAAVISLSFVLVGAWTRVSCAASFIFFKIQNAVMKGGIRPTEEVELAGMDMPEMGALAYPDFLEQEVITLSIFIPFAMFYMHQPIKLDYLWAGLCILGAVYFIFRS
jgi:hypothetical protein